MPTMEVLLLLCVVTGTVAFGLALFKAVAPHATRCPVRLLRDAFLDRAGGRTAPSLAFAVGLVACAWRILDFSGFQNDHYVYLARAQQLLLGDWPVRDFVDPGFPLMYFPSAAAWLLGRGAVGTEVLLVAGAFALAAVLTFLVAYRLSGSMLIAVAAALFEVLITPRTYNYPKILIYVAAAYGILAVAESPSRRRLLLLGALTAVAFLFRHDHGLYVGIAGTVTVVLATARLGWPAALSHVGIYAGATALLVSPWLIFVQYHQGLFEYFASGIAFSRTEAERNGGPLLFVAFGVGADWDESQNAHVWLFYVFRVLPLLCAAVVWHRWRSRRQSWPGEAVAMASLVVLAMFVNAGLLRGNLSVWLPDAVAPAVLLGAWLAPHAWRAAGWNQVARLASRVALVIVLIVSVAALALVGDVYERLGRTGTRAGLRGVTERVAGLWPRLWRSHRDAGLPPSGVSQALMPFFYYLERCTSTDDRLIMTHLYPDVFVMAGRGFAGGHEAYREPFYATTTDQNQMLARLRRESVPFVLLAAWREDEFRGNFEQLAIYIDDRYQPMTSFSVEESEEVRVLVEKRRAAVRVDPETGWPCFK